MRHRSVIEIMVIIFTFVVAFIILGSGFVVCLVEIRDPSADTSDMVRALVTIITLILGSLLGMLAGKSSVVAQDLSKRPGEASSYLAEKDQ